MALRVKTSDGHTVEVSQKLRDASDFFRDTEGPEDGDGDELLLQHVTARQLELAQTFVDFITDENPFPHISKPLPLMQLNKIVGTLYADFARQIDMNEVIPLILAADFLGLNDLHELLCTHVALAASEGNLRIENLDPSLL
jgi:hypothetical protein